MINAHLKSRPRSIDSVPLFVSNTILKALKKNQENVMRLVKNLPMHLTTQLDFRIILSLQYIFISNDGGQSFLLLHCLLLQSL